MSLQKISNKELVCKIYKEHLKFNNKKANNQLKVDKRAEPATHQRKFTEIKQAYERTFNIIYHWGTQIKTM